jgi:adenylate cyclase class 2
MATPQLEIERRYRRFDEDTVRSRLAAAGTRKGKFLFRLVSYVPAGEVTTIRVRDEGYRVTMTVKRRVDSGAYLAESEVVVNSFDRGAEMLDMLGFERHYYLEKFREIFEFEGAEVVFDTYPGLPPYIEVEAPTEAIMLQAAAALGLDAGEPQDWAAGDMYLELYGITKDRPMTGLTFAGVRACLGPLATKNAGAFHALAQQQQMGAAQGCAN